MLWFENEMSLSTTQTTQHQPQTTATNSLILCISGMQRANVLVYFSVTSQTPKDIQAIIT